MSDLRFESSDGEYLHLESADGTSYRLLIDDGVRRAIRRDVINDQDSVKISPRDIQLEIRAGVSLEELVAKTGASFEYVEKFAAPVIDELAHIVKSALSVRITMAGDRYSDTTQIEFGEVIANRLAAAGEVNYSWSARRSDNGGWQLHCRYGDNVATWAFDPRKLALSPENENAISLSTQQSLTDGPIPKLRPVLVTGATEVPPTDPVPVSVPPVTELISIVTQQANPPQPASVQKDQPTAAPVTPLRPVNSNATDSATSGNASNLTEELGRTAEFDGVVPFGREANATAAPESAGVEDLANTADLLDALRRRRLDRERETMESSSGFVPPVIETPPTRQQAFEEFDSFTDELPEEGFEPSDQQLASEVVEPEVEEDAKPKKPARASMPSWDSIVFSQKSDEED